MTDMAESRLEKAQTALAAMERAAESSSPLHDIDPRAKLVVTLLYLLTVLSFPLRSTASLIVFAIYPIVVSAMSATPYETVLRKSLVVVPFAALIGIFNPIADRTPAFTVAGVTVSCGWLEFASILIRGVLSVQGVLVMIHSTSFHRLCRSMTRMGLPAVFATQLMFLYRYLFVLVDEAVGMDCARKSRSYGRKSYPLRMYATFVGQLLVRTVARSRRIYNAMLARGFDGSIPCTGGYERWTARDTLFTAVWAILFAAGRFINIPALFNM